MRALVGIYLLVHGVCHFVGFLVPWKIIHTKEEPYTTKLLSGAIDVGDVGIRMVGIVWLLAGLAFLVTGIGTFTSSPWWRGAAFALAMASTVLSVLGLPGAKIGILANAALLAYLALIKLGWLPAIHVS